MLPGRHRCIRTTLLGAAVLGILALTACGAPEYEYPKSSEHKTYLRVPTSWHRLDQDLVDKVTYGDLESASTRQVRDASWTVAYDAADEPDVLHLIRGYPVEAPTVHATVLPVQNEEFRGQISFDVLRDFNLPVSKTAREAAEQNPDFPLSDFELLSEEILTPEPGLHGVRAVFNYRSEVGGLQTYDQTMMTNDDASVLYMLMVRCSAGCYSTRAEEIQRVVESFTVRSK
jgi:hypothetical protein